MKVKKKKSKKKSFQQRKAGIGKLWKKAKKQVEETPDQFATVEKGRYLAKLISAAVTEIGDRGWKNFAIGFAIQEGEFEGTQITRRCGLESEENLTFLIRDLQRLGVDTDDLEINSEEELNELGVALVKIAPVCRIRVSEPNDQGFQNVYIDKLISAEETASGEAVWEKGDRVQTEIDGDTYAGIISKKIAEDDTAAFITFDDGDKQEVELDALEAEEGAATSPTWEKGDRVMAKVDGEPYPGAIAKVKADSVLVDFDDGDKQEVDMDDLEAEEGADAKDVSDLLGETRGFKKGKKMLVGKILSVDEDDNTFIMKTDAGKKVTGDIDDLEKPEDSPKDTDAVGIGDEVIVEHKGKDVIATVKSVDEADNEATVLLKKLKKKITVSLDELYVSD